MRCLAFYLLLVGLVISLILGSVGRVEAVGEFQQDSVVTYNVKTDGTTEVIHKINLKNKEVSVYAVGFTLTLDGYVPNKVEAFDRGGRMAISQQEIGQKTLLNLTFNDMAVGKGNDYPFTIRYSQSDIAHEKGQVWEVIIPKQADALQSEIYTLKLVVPTSFGRVSFVSPSDYVLHDDGQTRTFTFEKKQAAQSRVVAAFGPMQVFDFNLKYHLQNQEGIAQEREIALPPDTTYQRVRFDAITPTPDSIKVDEDGNWLAEFFLAPSERLDIEVSGSVEISAAALRKDHLSQMDKRRYLGATRNWQIDDLEIQNLAKTLKSPKEIYDYVVSHLKYDYGRATITSETTRLGAKAALENPDKAICTEFTDLFIALARAAGIPARELQGYAYTNDLQLQPLSLVRDSLHAWPEFWDEKKGEWTQVDPTWGNTTGGVDFFTNLDFNHFVFVVHGRETDNPKPAGSYRTGGNGRDVDIRFGEFRAFGQPQIELYYQPNGFIVFPLLASNGKLVVRNLGHVSVPGLKIDLEGSTFKSYGGLIVGIIPPFGSSGFDVREEGGILDFSGKAVLVSVGGGEAKNVKVGIFRLVFAQCFGGTVLVGGLVLILSLILWRKRLIGVYFARGRTNQKFN